MGLWELGFIAFILVSTLFWLAMLIWVSLDTRLGPNQRTAWLIGIVLTHFVGAGVYLLTRLSRKLTEGE
jgi:uncharacterized membrane protein